MARLILATAEGQQAIELRPINSLGRHPNNTIQLLDKIVSKEHCILEQRDGQFILRDLGSLNGTYINGERVRGEQLLRHGDEITLGSTRARYDDGSGAAMGHGGWAPGVHGPGAIAHGGPPSPQPGHPSSPHPSQGAPYGGSPSAMPPSGFRGAQPQGGMPSAPPAPSAPGGQTAYGTGAPAQPYGAPFGAPPAAPSAPGSGPNMGAPRQGPPMPGAMGQGPAAPVGPTARPGQGLPGGMPNPYAPAAHRPPSFGGTRVDVLDSARSIGTQIAAETKGFAPFERIAADPQQLKLDYERLRVTWELTRDIGLERDLDKLLEKILLALFTFVNADRGVILLKEGDGTLSPRAARRRDGTDRPIEVSSTILNHVMKERASVLTHDASMDFAASKGKSMILNRISSAIVVPLLHEKEVLGALWVDSESLAQFQPKDLEILTSVANQAALFIENTLLAKKIEQEIVARERFSRLLSPNVAEQVLSGKLKVEKGGQFLQECTVFNSDIRGFTRMSEGASADEMVDMLNEYFELMVETIFKYEGTLDKFMGDGIMAFWGAPAIHPDDPIRSVSCALDQMEVLGRFNRKRVEQNKAPLSIGMGIHTGTLVAGYVGSSKALSYTVIGDTANTSARLCGIAEAGQIIVSEQTLVRLGDRFEVEELPAAKLKGKEKPLRIFNVKSAKPAAAVARAV